MTIYSEGVLNLISLFYTTSNMKKYRHGFTLMEAMLASVILVVAAGAILVSFTAGATSSAYSERLRLSFNLATNLMEEIIASDYDDVVLNYDGYTESSGAIKSSNGDVIESPEYANFSRSVACHEIYLEGQSALSSPPVILVEVMVAYNGRELVTIKEIKGR